MIKEKSCGAVVYKIVNGVFYFVIEKMQKGHYSIPKGHVENNETELETAYREIKEETNLDVKIDDNFRVLTSYSPYENCIKDVVFFVAQIIKENIVAQECEVSDIKILTFDEAYKTLTHTSDKQVLFKAYVYLLKRFMKKVIVIGSPGSGKSYLTKQIAPYIDLPIYHLDNLYWFGNWEHISTQELLKKQQEIMEKEKWLLDGHYQNTLKERIQNADTIIYFKLPGKTCYNAIYHRIKNHPIREDMPSSCVETEFNDEFQYCVKHFKMKFGKQIQEWLKKYPRNVVTLYSKKMMNEFIEYII